MGYSKGNSKRTGGRGVSPKTGGTSANALPGRSAKTGYKRKKR